MFQHGPQDERTFIFVKRLNLVVANGCLFVVLGGFRGWILAKNIVINCVIETGREVGHDHADGRASQLLLIHQVSNELFNVQARILV